MGIWEFWLLGEFGFRVGDPPPPKKKDGNDRQGLGKAWKGLGFREKLGMASLSCSIPKILLHKNTGILWENLLGSSKLPLEFFSLENGGME